MVAASFHLVAAASAPLQINDGILRYVVKSGGARSSGDRNSNGDEESAGGESSLDGGVGLPTTTGEAADDPKDESRRLTGDACPTTCNGFSCDYWAANTCAELEGMVGCNCDGCACANDGIADDDDCPATCFTQTCDAWLAYDGTTCAASESLYLCNCAGCNCGGGTDDNDCPATCYGFSCDGWTANTCSEMEGYGCNCDGCACANDGVDCPAMCYGQPCDSWIENTCLSLEVAGCDCNGCACVNDQAYEDGCFDTSDGAVDILFNDCFGYSNNPDFCFASWDNQDFSASVMCCVCGGGTMPDPTVAPTQTASPSTTPAPTPEPNPFTTYNQLDNRISNLEAGGTRVLQAASSISFADEIEVGFGRSVHIFSSTTTTRQTFSGAGSTRLFWVQHNAVLHLEHLQLIHGFAHDDLGFLDGQNKGGVIAVYYASLTLTDCIVSDSYAEFYVRSEIPRLAESLSDQQHIASCGGS